MTRQLIGYVACFVVFVVVFIESSSGAFESTKSTSQVIVHSDGFSRAMKRSVEHKAGDELQAVFRISPVTTIPGDKIFNLTTLLPLQSGLLVHDWMKKRIQKVDPASHGMVMFGKQGAGQGGYLTPSSMSESAEPDKGIWVTDFSLSRVSRLSTDGQYIHSFSTGNQRFSAKGIVQSPSTRQVAVCGNNLEKGQVWSLHSYTSDGSFLGSVYALPDRFARLGVDSANDCLFAKSTQDAFVGFSYEYIIYRIDRDGVSVALNGDKTHFREPSSLLRLDSSDQEESMRRFDDWSLKATPINAIAVMNDSLLLVQYETFDPLRYRLDIWDLGSKSLGQSVRTNHRLLAARDGAAFFLEQMDGADQSEYSILRGDLAR